jgi:hypothetical protein
VNPPFRSALVSVALVATLASRAVAAEDVVLADFEATTYGSWTVTGDAFGPGPARGSLPGQMAVNGFKGQGLVNSFFKGDDSTGTLTSPEFRIERKFLSFLIGGGSNPEKLALQLLVDGKVVRTATGPNSQSGGSEALAPESWDVSEFAGRNAILRIVGMRDDADEFRLAVNDPQRAHADRRDVGRARRCGQHPAQRPAPRALLPRRLRRRLPARAHARPCRGETTQSCRLPLSDPSGAWRAARRKWNR